MCEPATPFDPGAVIDAMAQMLDLPVDPAWRPGIVANLEATVRFARIVLGADLPDEAEPAPVFSP